VIGVRLHALILAIRFGVPILALPYDPKVSGLLEDVRYPLGPLWLPGAKFNAPRADALVDEAWLRHDELAAHLATAAAEQRTLAARNFEVLESLGAPVQG